MGINVTCSACNQAVAAPDSMAGKRAVCPNCKAVIAIPEQFVPATVSDPEPAPEPVSAPPSSLHEPAPSLNIANSDTRAQDEQAALAWARRIYVFFRDDWRRIPTCTHLWFAFFLFFLPWVNISCGGQKVVSQTGLQTCYGATTVDARFEKMGRNARKFGGNPNWPKVDEPAPWSVLSVIYITFIFLGGFMGLACACCAIFRLHNIAAATHLFSLGLGSAAFLALAAQLFIGFPVEKHIKQQIEKSFNDQNRNNPFGGVQNAGELVEIEPQYSGWLWWSVFLSLVSIPIFLLEFTILIVEAVRKHMRHKIDTG
jgi:hypothetical protein